MGWRFRKYITIFPGVRLNISKSGVSLTFGTKGASVNVGKDGAYVNTSIPGTGWYNRKKIFPLKNENGDANIQDKPQELTSEETEYKAGVFSEPSKQMIEFNEKGSNTDAVNEGLNKIVEKKLDMINIPNLGKADPIFYEVASFVVSNKSCNISVLKNKFSAGPNRISRILDQLEQIGVVKRSSDFKIDVLIEDIESLNMLFERLQNEGISTTPIDNLANGQKKEVDRIANNNPHYIGYIDPKLYEIAEIIVKKQSCSTSLIQRVLTTGLERASHIIDQLEQIGIVRRVENYKIDVLVKDSASLDEIFANIKYEGISENCFGITEDYYNDVTEIVQALVKLYQDIKNDITVMYAIADCLPQEYGTKERKLAALFLADLMKVHHYFGHSTQNLVNREGLPLLLLSSLILSGRNSLDVTYGSINKLEDLSKTVPSVFSSLSHIFDHYPEDNFFFIGQTLSRCRRRSFYTRYFTLLYRLFSLIAKADGKITENETLWLNKLLELNPQRDNVNIVFNVGGTPSYKPEVPIAEVNTQETIKQEEKPQESNPIKKLNDLIGLSNVKTEISSLSNLVKIQQERKNRGMSISSISYHCVFTGNPGTGKTTVARIVAEIYKNLGVLKKGQLIETDRSGLVGEYVGQTAPKTNAIIDSALDGVLFIDEAYSLVQGGQNDYGKEAISTLLKRMEDDRDRLVVILAGYSKEMEDFINSNSGLQSRFSRYIDFPDYTADELIQIFQYTLKNNDCYATEGAFEKAKEHISSVIDNKDQNFGNARFIRNFFEKILTEQANRLASVKNITNDMLARIEEADVLNAI